jgi:hypothetical protein
VSRVSAMRMSDTPLHVSVARARTGIWVVPGASTYVDPWPNSTAVTVGSPESAYVRTYP